MRISNLYVYSKSGNATAAIILLLTIFTFEQQQLYAYTYFSNPNDTNFNHIAQIYQGKKIISFGIADTPERDETLPNSIAYNPNGIYIIDNKKEYTSRGCDPGFGYEVSDENPICEPLGKTKEERDNQTKFANFCEALGCPFNPPSPYVD